MIQENENDTHNQLNADNVHNRSLSKYRNIIFSNETAKRIPMSRMQLLNYSCCIWPRQCKKSSERLSFLLWSFSYFFSFWCLLLGFVCSLFSLGYMNLALYAACHFGASVEHQLRIKGATSCTSNTISCTTQSFTLSVKSQVKPA